MAFGEEMFSYIINRYVVSVNFAIYSVSNEDCFLRTKKEDQKKFSLSYFCPPIFAL